MSSGCCRLPHLQIFDRCFLLLHLTLQILEHIGLASICFLSARELLLLELEVLFKLHDELLLTLPVVLHVHHLLLHLRLVVLILQIDLSQLSHLI